MRVIFCSLAIVSPQKSLRSVIQISVEL
jgi:hypothetical protein